MRYRCTDVLVRSVSSIRIDADGWLLSTSDIDSSSCHHTQLNLLRPLLRSQEIRTGVNELVDGQRMWGRRRPIRMIDLHNCSGRPREVENGGIAFRSQRRWFAPCGTQLVTAGDDGYIGRL